jgi:hypothetical protein
MATTNLVNSMQEAAISSHAQALLGSLHAILADPAAARYLTTAAANTLAAIADELSEAPARPMASAYAAFMPHLAPRLEPAISSRHGKLSAALLHGIGKLAAAAGTENVAADVSSLVPSIAALLPRKEVTEDRELLRGAHAALTCLASVSAASFLPTFEQILPGLLTSAALEVEFQMDHVEEEDRAADERDADAWEVEYHPKKTGGLIKIRCNKAQMDEKLLALDSLFSYAKALGAHFHPAVSPLVTTCLPLLTYKWSDKARGVAATVLAEAYKCVVLAAAEGVGGMAMGHAIELVGAIFKPIADQLNKEESLVAVDSLLDALRELLVLERTHGVGALNGAALNQVIQVTKRQLQLDEARMKQLAEAGGEEEDDEEAEDDEAQEQEAEVLTTIASLTAEILRQHGESALSQVEAQLLQHIQPWMSVRSAEPTDREIVRLALCMETVASTIEHTGKEAAKQYVVALLPLINQHLAAEDKRLRLRHPRLRRCSGAWRQAALPRRRHRRCQAARHDAHGARGTLLGQCGSIGDSGGSPRQDARSPRSGRRRSLRAAYLAALAAAPPL